MTWLVIFAIAVVIYMVAKKKKPKPKQPDWAANFKLEPVVRQNQTLSSQTRPTKPNFDPARWLPAGEPTTVQGISISGGMLYVGGRFPGQGNYDTVNCLIDPTLSVAASAAGASLNYWPAYASISPVARRAYLEWLANGRNDPNADIGLVFLFFYGLERRLFLDKAFDEALVIVTEVSRLLRIYSGNNSFRGYAERFLETSEILIGGRASKPDMVSPDRLTGELGMQLQIYLGRKLAAGEPLNADDALAWLLGMPDVYSKTVLTRCWDEFKALWQVYYDRKFPKGLKITPPKRLLKVEYNAASSNFSTAIPLQGEIPDILAISAPLKGLRELYNRCTDELDSYSRFLGRKPHTRGKVESLLLLPKVIQQSVQGSTLKPVTEHFTAAFEKDEFPVTSVDTLLKTLDLPIDEAKSNVMKIAQVAPALDALNIGFEPDRRVGTTSFPKDGTVVAFKLGEQHLVDPEKPEYQIAKTLIDVTSLAAASDGGASEAEFAATKAEIESMPGLSGAERLRLAAYAKLMSVDVPRQQAVMNRLAKLPPADKRRAANSAIASVLADGRVDPGEMKFLEKLYKALGLPAEELYSAIHRGAVTVDEPVTVAPEEAAPGRVIPKRPAPPPPPTPAKEGISIDLARLERIKRETSAVSSLLADIFVEESSVPAPPPGAAEKSHFDGLDPAHGQLLSMFLAKPELDRSEFEERARALQLMPDGAIETINDWAFDAFDEPLLEGEDTVVVADHLVDKLKGMEARV